MFTSMEKEYFEQLLDAKFAHINSEIENLKDNTNKILAQTIKTNGRVTELERLQYIQTGRNEEDNKHSGEIKWWLVFLITFVSSIATVIATKLWH